MKEDFLALSSDTRKLFFEKLLHKMSSVPETPMDRKRKRQNSLKKSAKARWRFTDSSNFSFSM